MSKGLKMEFTFEFWREKEHEKGPACRSRFLEAGTTEVNKSEDKGRKPPTVLTCVRFHLLSAELQ